MANKMKVIIITSILAIAIFSGLTIGNRIISTKKPAPSKDPKGYFIVGMPSGQRAGLVKEIEYASKEDSYVKKGDLLMQEGKIDEAMKDYETALSLARFSGSKAIVYIHIANGYEKMRDYKKALEYVIIDRDKFVNDWAKEPVIERTKYLEYALQGEYDLAIEHAQKALEADAKLPNTPKGGSPDYIERLNDLKAAKDYILSLEKK